MAIKLPRGFCQGCGQRVPGQGKWCEIHRPNKFNNQKTGTAGSKVESDHGTLLANLQRAGKIRNLEAQVPFVFFINGVRVAKYVADYVYEIEEKGHWTRVVVDVKGVRTDYYKLKARLFRAFMGFSITEVTSHARARRPRGSRS